MTPVLVVHGIWDSAARIEPLRRGLAERGLARATALDLLPNNGSVEIAALGAQVRSAAQALASASPSGRIDLVGFSMGALTARWFVQRGGHELGGEALIAGRVGHDPQHAHEHAEHGGEARGVGAQARRGAPHAHLKLPHALREGALGRALDAA